MSDRFSTLFILCVLAMMCVPAAQVNAAAAESSVESGSPYDLRTGWRLQSACVDKSSGEEISLPDYRPTGWIEAQVPGTVLGSQVAAGVFPDPFFGMNLRKIPGTDYPLGKIFGYFPMSENSPYHCSWWYRTSFAVPGAAGKTTTLHFDGINYRANIWLNGKQIAHSDQVAGAFRSYDFDISAALREQKNGLAIEVFAQTEHDLGIDFLDWNPAPADKSLGLWRGVSLRTTGSVTVSYPAVSTHFLNDALSEAELRVVADIANHADHEVKAIVTAEMGAIHLQQPVTLAAHEARVVLWKADQFPELRIKHPAIWWPYQYGEPHLERLRVAASVDGVASDAANIRFGIRETESFLNKSGYLQFRINHRDILVRGGGWNADLFYREPAERLRQELAYVKHMNLNTVRLEGKMGSDELFSLADEMGILMMPGWQCCDFWQSWDKWTPQDHTIAHASLYSQISRLRSHASMLGWFNGSDEIPIPLVEKDYLAVLQERDWSNPVLNSAADRTSTISGASGVKMSGPYDYVPPEYWYIDKDHAGGAFGFNTETGPGAAVPSVASIRRTLPSTSWWPIDAQWNYHAALGKFAQYKRQDDAMDATYGAATGLEDYVRKAQLMAYDGERAMFEAYGANKYRSTGVIQWMLNNAWPSFFWHLYDYYLVPGGGYFGTRKANEPLHIQYRFDDRKVVVVNSTLHDYPDLHATMRLVDVAGAAQFVHESPVSVASDGVATAFAIPEQATTTFLRLTLRDGAGKVVSENCYWLPAKLADMNWGKTTYVNTPANNYANMRDLASLRPALLQWSAHRGKARGEVVIDMKNESKSVAFFMHLRAVKPGTEDEIVPIFWDDNFVSLLPGESTVVTAKGLVEGKAGVELKLDGWNVAPRTILLSPTASPIE
jgi:exo-1,4-beta-D-glucosaminidase